MSKTKINLAIVGVGKWGKNLLREFNKISNVLYCCSKTEGENSKEIRKIYPNIKLTTRFEDILEDSSVDAVVIATPIKTHFKLAKESLLAGKHTFVEKPISDNIKEIKSLIRIAQEKKLALFTDNIFLRHPTLRKLKTIIGKRKINYLRLDWNKWGTFGEDIFFNLAYHYMYIVLDLLGPIKSGNILDSQAVLTDADIITFELISTNNRNIFVNINRVSSMKSNVITITINKEIFVWEDMELYRGKADLLDLIYQATITSLEIVCQDFLRAIKQPKKSYLDAVIAMKVLRIIKILKHSNL